MRSNNTGSEWARIGSAGIIFLRSLDFRYVPGPCKPEKSLHLLGPSYSTTRIHTMAGGIGGGHLHVGGEGEGLSDR